MRLLLTSAGLRNDAIAHELVKLAGRTFTELNIIHIPTAANAETGDKQWIIDDLKNLERYDFKSIDILDIAAIPKAKAYERMRGAHIISFGGGDAQYLASVFQEYDMKNFLSEALRERVYMGTSAGSMVIGQFLPHKLLNIVYPEEIFNDVLVPSMEFAPLCFIPHLNSEWFPHARKDTLDRLDPVPTHTVYCTDDETALSVVDGNVKVIGTGEYWISKK